MTTYPQTAPSSNAPVRWLAAGGAAMIACAIVTASSQASGEFRWWALFILVPGALIAASGAALLARGGSGTLAGYFVASIGAIVFATGAILMFGAMGDMWPLMIVLPSLAVAGSYLWRPVNPLARAFHRTIAMLAVAGVALGGTFLAVELGRFTPGTNRWWAWYMIAAGVIVVGNGAELVRHRMAYRVSAAVLAMAPGLVSILLGARFLRDWPINW